MPAGGKKTSEDASGAVGNGSIMKYIRYPIDSMAFSVDDKRPGEKCGLQRLINQLLSYDQDILDEVAGLSGKVIQIELINTAQPVISLIFAEDGIEISADREGRGDVLIRGTPFNLLAYVISSQSGKTNITGDMEITGDVGLAQDFQRLLQRLEIDWEEQLSRLVGDTLARKTNNVVKSGIDFLLQLKNKAQMDISEYALYEKEVLPDKDEIENFNHSIDVLRDDLERIKQRIKRLENKCSV